MNGSGYSNNFLLEIIKGLVHVLKVIHVFLLFGALVGLSMERIPGNSLNTEYSPKVQSYLKSIKPSRNFRQGLVEKLEVLMLLKNETVLVLSQ